MEVGRDVEVQLCACTGAIHGVCFVDKATAKATGKEVQR